MGYFLAYSFAAFTTFWVSLFFYHLGNQKRRGRGEAEQDNIVGGSILLGLVWPVIVLVAPFVWAVRLFRLINTGLEVVAVKLAGGDVAVPGDRSLHGENARHDAGGTVHCTQHDPATARFCPRCGRRTRVERGQVSS